MTGQELQGPSSSTLAPLQLEFKSEASKGRVDREDLSEYEPSDGRQRKGVKFNKRRALPERPHKRRCGHRQRGGLREPAPLRSEQGTALLVVSATSLLGARGTGAYSHSFLLSSLTFSSPPSGYTSPAGLRRKYTTSTRSAWSRRTAPSVRPTTSN